MVTAPVAVTRVGTTGIPPNDGPLIPSADMALVNGPHVA